MRQSLAVRQSLSLSQIMRTVSFMSLPDEALSLIAERVSADPDNMEGRLTSIKKQVIGRDVVKGDVACLYDSLKGPSGDSTKSRNGMIGAPDLTGLEADLGDAKVEIKPDVIYTGVKNNKPKFVFSSYLKGENPFLGFELDQSKHPNAYYLCIQLRRFDNWKKGVLRNAYVAIGEAQREFFEDLDYTRVRIFSQDNLADRLDLSNSTISRVFANRCIEAKNADGSKKEIINTKDLLITAHDLQKCLALPYLNQALEEEFKIGEAYSDFELLRKVRGIARRTITKYRTHSKIPNSAERTRIYSEKERQEPYVFSR